MNYGKEGSPLSNTSMYLEANAIFWMIVNKEERWIPRVMNEYFWGTLQTAEPIEFLIP